MKIVLIVSRTNEERSPELERDDATITSQRKKGFESGPTDAGAVEQLLPSLCEANVSSRRCRAAPSTLLLPAHIKTLSDETSQQFVAAVRGATMQLLSINTTTDVRLSGSLFK
ncbi:hypothetical protein F2P81_021060 [Scophthalmus maximus]|uniref:Uncharacterized protein n=1 Tax=Scophthalmus maximus TaxID=52904 RepID=A0A6A4RW92_SCOMX|nr:hypothetical protein F2P81_021060 [Scophthalmus maximus]